MSSDLKSNLKSHSKTQSARANGAKSRGPATPEGRAKSSRNSLRHGLSAKSVLLPAESHEQFQLLLDAHIQQFHPANPVEMDLVEAMAVARWRVQRSWAMESAAIARQQRIEESAHGHEDAATLAAMSFDTLSNPPRSLEALSQREGRYERICNHAADRLIQSQERRRKMAPQSHNVIENKKELPEAEAIQTVVEPSPNHDQTVDEPGCQAILPFTQIQINRVPPQREEYAILNQDKKSPSSC